MIQTPGLLKGISEGVLNLLLRVLRMRVEGGHQP